jgi:hypothetical protein
MWRNFLFVLIIVLSGLMFNSCSKNYVLLFETNSKDLEKNEDNFYIFENDSIKITYSLWGLRGPVSFIIENKHDKPLYINWQKSSLIMDGQKRDYWRDVTTSSTVTETSNRGFSIVDRDGDFHHFGTTRGFSSTTTIRDEKITFLPSHTRANKRKFIILTQNSYTLNKDATKTEFTFYEKPRKKPDYVYEKFYVEGYSPFQFRNFLTLSFEGEGINEFYLDHEFYVAKITEMKQSQFEYKTIEKGFTKTVRRFENPSSFYIFIRSYNSVKHR